MKKDSELNHCNEIYQLTGANRFASLVVWKAKRFCIGIVRKFNFASLASLRFCSLLSHPYPCTLGLWNAVHSVPLYASGGPNKDRHPLPSSFHCYFTEFYSTVVIQSACSCSGPPPTVSSAAVTATTWSHGR